MELTIESAFSTGGMVGHLAYLLLVASMLMRQMVFLRILVIASALVAIVYAFVWLNDPVSSFWESLLVTVNVIQLFITWRQNRSAQFTEEELAFATRHFRGLPPREQARLLQCGHWENLEIGRVMTTEGEHPDHLYFLSTGAAEVCVGDRVVATCEAGAYVGEMSYIAGRPASATVVVSEPARAWCIPRATLAKFDDTQPAWLSVIEAGIARDLRRKVIASNEQGGMAPA